MARAYAGPLLPFAIFVGSVCFADFVMDPHVVICRSKSQGADASSQRSCVLLTHEHTRTMLPGERPRVLSLRGAGVETVSTPLQHANRTLRTRTVHALPLVFLLPQYCMSFRTFTSPFHPHSV